MMKTVIIVQARMGSTRLPEKVLKMLSDRTVIGHVLERCKAISAVDQIIVATTYLQEDEAICLEAERNGVVFHRGSSDDVLSRYYSAAVAAQADVVVRITSDCPLLDPEVSNDAILDFLNGDYDYSTSTGFPRGLDTEIFTFQSLEQAFHAAKLDYEHEHVTPYLYGHPELFKLHKYASPRDHSEYRLTLDTEEDWMLISKIYERLYNGQIFGLSEVLDLLEREPDLAEINQHIRQKKLGE